MASSNRTGEVLNEVEEVKGIMNDNIDKVMRNVESAETLQDKTETLRDESKTFKKQSTQLKRGMWWRNMKLNIIICLIITAVLAIILVPIILTQTNKN